MENEKKPTPLIAALLSLLPSLVQLFLRQTPRKGRKIRNTGIVMALLAAIPELLQLITPELLMAVSPEARHYIFIAQEILFALAALNIVGGQAQIAGNPDEVLNKPKIKKGHNV